MELPLKCRSERQRSQFLREQWATNSARKKLTNNFLVFRKGLTFAAQSLSLEFLGKEPFQEEVENLLQSTATRVFVRTCSLRGVSLKIILLCIVFLCSQGADAGFSLHEIMPSHLRLRALTDKCRSLTETWHGRVPRLHVRGNTVQ